nr:hypothetical protein [Escherichia coli]
MPGKVNPTQCEALAMVLPGDGQRCGYQHGRSFRKL